MLEKLICPHTGYGVPGFSGAHNEKQNPKILDDLEVDISQQELRETVTSKQAALAGVW